MTPTPVTEAVSPGQHAIEELKKLWGSRHFERKLTAARALARSLGPQFIEALEETGAGDDPRIIQAFAILAERLEEPDINADAVDGHEPQRLTPLPRRR